MTIDRKLRLFIPETDTTVDALSRLDSFLERAKSVICNYCHIDSVPEQLEDLQVDLALKFYNRWGQEGSSSYSEGGKSQTFEEILSPDVRRQLYKYRVIE